MTRDEVVPVSRLRSPGSKQGEIRVDEDVLHRPELRRVDGVHYPPDAIRDRGRVRVTPDNSRGARGAGEEYEGETREEGSHYWPLHMSFTP